ncbi:hypothetical protein BDV34DRAFT_220734 [Aspergillus parasiticus]|uniref:Uncharacterized protein n=1 Tax=Aspergillus parasiticus TaxID=5067 RepID=A0A5N6DYX9_ASPPA|nr:hypothetical protein BDV34DRAFT_220734 [Aspergillus parasiticus]
MSEASEAAVVTPSKVKPDGPSSKRKSIPSPEQVSPTKSIILSTSNVLPSQLQRRVAVHLPARHVVLPFNLRLNKKALDREAWDQLCNLFPATVGVSSLDYFLVFYLGSLPPKPWPITIAGIQAYFTTDLNDDGPIPPIKRSNKSRLCISAEKGCRQPFASENRFQACRQIQRHPGVNIRTNFQCRESVTRQVVSWRPANMNCCVLELCSVQKGILSVEWNYARHQGSLSKISKGKGTWLRPWTAFHMAIESSQHHFRCPQRS